LFYTKTRTLSYVLVVIGALIFVYGAWQYLPRSFRSDTPDSVFMAISAKRIVFPLVGMIITVIGYTFLKLVHEIDEEMKSLRNELSIISNKIDKSSK